MPLTMRHSSGDAVLEDLCHIDLVLADDARSADIRGLVQKVGADEPKQISATVAAPAAPSSGSIFWLVQVNLSDGTVSEKQSAAAMPPTDADNLVVLQLELTPAVTVVTDAVPTA